MLRFAAIVLAFVPALALAQATPPKVGEVGAVDAQSVKPFDPSKNVLDLVEAAIRRQDDLRDANARLAEIRLAVIEARLVDAEKYNKLQADKIEGELALRSYYERLLADAEAKRIDAVRLVDTNAVAVERQRTAEQATILSTQVARTADDGRTLVASTATSTAAALAQITNSQNARISALEQGSYQQQGKQTFSDPALVSMQSDVRALLASRATTTGNDTGRSDQTAYIFAGLGLLIALMSAIFAFRTKAVPVPTDTALADLLREVLKSRSGKAA
jgi:hypothetical protein